MTKSAQIPVERKTESTQATPPTENKQDTGLDASILENKLGYQVRMLDRIMTRDFTQDVGMTRVQFSVFSLVATNENLSQAEVGEALFMDRASTMAIINKLEDAGLIKRTKSPHDKRMHALQLTPQGREQFPEINRRVNAHEEVFRELLTPSELESFFKCLWKLRK